jgi:hypothetical protein
MLIKHSKVNYLLPDCQGFLTNIAELLTIIGDGKKSCCTRRRFTPVAGFSKVPAGVRTGKIRKSNDRHRSESISR